MYNEHIMTSRYKTRVLELYKTHLYNTKVYDCD